MNDELEPRNSVHTRHVIWRMYRDAADQDYLMARFAARSNLIYQFWWNAQQTVEKYLKACLLLNAIPVKDAGHNLTQMFTRVTELAGELLPALHCPPRFVRRKTWTDTNPRGFYPVSKFVELIEKNGNTNNRYRTFSVHTLPEYLIYFDELSFCLRRIAFPLDMELSENGRTAREELLADTDRQLHPTMGFDGNLEKKHKPFWETTFQWCNFAYFPEESVATGNYPTWGGSINSELFLAYQSKQESYRNAVLWIAELGFPKSLRQEVQKSYLGNTTAS